MKIENVNNLLKFLRENWDSISDKTYNEILFESLNVFEVGKRETYENSEKLILKYVDFVSSQPSNWEKPIFLELDI
jgi:hypothetical protein